MDRLSKRPSLARDEHCRHRSSLLSLVLVISLSGICESAIGAASYVQISGPNGGSINRGSDHATNSRNWSFADDTGSTVSTGQLEGTVQGNVLGSVATASATSSGIGQNALVVYLLEDDDVVRIDGPPNSRVLFETNVTGVVNVAAPPNSSVGNIAYWFIYTPTGTVYLNVNNATESNIRRAATIAVPRNGVRVHHQFSGSVLLDASGRNGEFAASEDVSGRLEFHPAEPNVAVKLESQLTERDLLKNAVTAFETDSRTAVKAVFAPRFGFSVDEAAAFLGYDHFNWLQIVTEDPYHLTFSPIVPYFDPVQFLGDGSPNRLPYSQEYADNKIFYLNEGGTESDIYSWQSQVALDRQSFEFYDRPHDTRLNRDLGEHLKFVTGLVGVRESGDFDVLSMFAWKSDYTGTQGNTEMIRATVPHDDGSMLGPGNVSDIVFFDSLSNVPNDVIQLVVSSGGRFLFVPEPSTAVMCFWIFAWLSARQGRGWNNKNCL